MPTAYASTVVHAPADRVWALVRDFNGLKEWHPAVTDSGHCFATFAGAVFKSGLDALKERFGG